MLDFSGCEHWGGVAKGACLSRCVPSRHRNLLHLPDKTLQLTTSRQRGHYARPIPCAAQDFNKYDSGSDGVPGTSYTRCLCVSGYQEGQHLTNRRKQRSRCVWKYLLHRWTVAAYPTQKTQADPVLTPPQAFLKAPDSVSWIRGGGFGKGQFRGPCESMGIPTLDPERCAERMNLHTRRPSSPLKALRGS